MVNQRGKPPSIARPTVTAHVTLTVAGKPLAGDYTVPAGLARTRHVVPAARTLMGKLVSRAVDEAAARGETVSCQKGCGACCRQLVPISLPETYLIRELVRSMPVERRTEIERRIADARARIEAAGLLGPLLGSAPVSSTLTALGLDYFRLGIPCPFLEDESCSIHPDRPIVCRDYLVTSPAEECAKPSAQNVRKLPVLGDVVGTMMSFGSTSSKPEWVSLTLACEWAESHPEPSATRTGPELLRSFFAALAQEPATVPNAPGLMR